MDFRGFPTMQGALESEPVGGYDVSRSCDHPYVAFFHLFFRSAAILTYMFCTWFSANFVLIFIICVLLLAFDFWTVKNVSGRLLVGLRWWNEILEDGSSEWRFESADVRWSARPVMATRLTRARARLTAQLSHRRGNSLDSGVFWGGLLVAPAIWALFAFGALLRLNFEWLLIVIVALGLNGANVVGYLRCKKGASCVGKAGDELAGLRRAPRVCQTLARGSRASSPRQG